MQPRNKLLMIVLCLMFIVSMAINIPRWIQEAAHVPAAVTEDVLQVYLPGKTFLSRATVGMWGVFLSNGKIDVYSGEEYDPKHPNQAVKKQTVTWHVSGDTLFLKFSEQTTLEWSLQAMKFLEKNGQTILSFDANCVNIVGSSSAKEGQSPNDLDASVKPGLCD
jgi:hypothetical protein